MVFVIPFLIKSIDYRLELFPAIILPSGTQKINLKGNVFITKNEIYGIDKSGKPKKLDKATFMGNVRMEYFNYFYNHRFGLIEVKNKKTTTTRLGIPYTIKSKISKEDISHTKKWLMQKLRNQNCVDSILILKKHRIVVQEDGGYYEDKLIINDTVLSLY